MHSTLLVAALLLATGGARAQSTPNVLLVVFDDVGIDQLSVYDDENGYTDPAGYAYAHTPTIDALAASGVRFNQYRTMPVCSSTRASLLSGRYPFRHGTGVSIKAEHSSPGFREFNKVPAPRFTLLPTVMSKAGFEPALVGKWHLGMDVPYGGTMDSHPNDIGLPTWWGVPANLLGQGSSLGGQSSAGYYDFWWVENVTRTRVQGIHATEHEFDRAQAWLSSTTAPFLLVLSLTACHTPLGGTNWPPSDHGFGPNPPPAGQLNTAYRACLEHADAKLGELLAGLDPNTIVILIGDNGTIPPAFRVPAGEVRYPIGHPLHQPGDETAALDVSPYKSWKVKKSVYEGGIRVPLIVSGPGVVAPGRTSDELVDVVDLMPTIANLTGAKLPPAAADGRDFSKVLTKPFGRGRRAWSFAEIFIPNGVATPASRVTQRRAFVRRKGAHLWKLVHIVENEPSKTPVDRYEFFHLAGPSAKTPVDPLEQNDLGVAHPAFKKTHRAYLELVGKG